MLKSNIGNIDWDLYTGELNMSNATLGENMTIKSGTLKAGKGIDTDLKRLTNKPNAE